MTTAASIWTVAALGRAAGGGLYFAASVATAIILVILAGLKPLEEAYRARVQSYVIRVTAERGTVAEAELRKVLRIRVGQIRRLVVTPGSDEIETVTLHLVRVPQADVRAGAERLREQPGVQEINVERKASTFGDHRD